MFLNYLHLIMQVTDIMKHNLELAEDRSVELNVMQDKTSTIIMVYNMYYFV